VVEPFGCNVDDFQRQIEDHFRRKAGFTHHDQEPLTATCPQRAG
jgi:hypothetical protein